MTTWADIDRVVAAQRAALNRADLAVVRRVLAALRRARTDVHHLEQQVADTVRELRRAGAPPEAVAATVRQQTHYQRMLAQLDAETQTLAQALRAEMPAAARTAARLGTGHAGDLIVLSTDTAFSTLNREALNAMVARLTGPGSPLSHTLAQLGPAARNAAERALLEAVAAGRHPSEVARAITRASRNVQAHRARTIARTEVLRAYRTSQIDTYRDMPAVTGWAWHAALDTSTCVACWAMHGRVFPTAEPMGTHPNCRCSTVPVTDEIGPPETGVERFDRLPAAAQARILGPGKYAAYQDGAVTLPDLVAVRRSPQWGTTRTTGSLTAALGPDRAREYHRRR